MSGCEPLLAAARAVVAPRQLTGSAVCGTVGAAIETASGDVFVVVALTLDDGPTGWTPEILKMLAAGNIPATFYLTGADLDRHPDQGAAIARAGHEIGNHTYTHRRMMLVSADTVADEIERTDAAIARTGYRGPLTFRPPYGKKLWTLPHNLAEHDRTTVTWDLEPDSAGAPTTAQIVNDTVENVRPGSIILCTSCSKADQRRAPLCHRLSTGCRPTATDLSR